MLEGEQPVAEEVLVATPGVVVESLRVEPVSLEGVLVATPEVVVESLRVEPVSLEGVPKLVAHPREL